VQQPANLKLSSSSSSSSVSVSGSAQEAAADHAERLLVDVVKPLACTFFSSSPSPPHSQSAPEP